MTTVFLAGIIQGSLPDAIHPQDYRREIGDLVRAHLPGAEIYDPFAHHPESLGYDEATGRSVFLDLMARAGRADLLIAFVPEASMGTAIEIWNARNAGAAVICVSPLAENWVVRFLPDILLPDIDALRRFTAAGGLADLLHRKGRGMAPGGRSG